MFISYHTSLHAVLPLAACNVAYISDFLARMYFFEQHALWKFALLSLLNVLEFFPLSASPPGRYALWATGSSFLPRNWTPQIGDVIGIYALRRAIQL
jgi:hypothetical protein